MKDTPKPDNRRPYDAAFRAEALRLAAQSRSTKAAARALNTGPKRLYQWQKAPKRQWRRLWALCWTRPRPLSCANCGPPTGDRRRNWKF